MAFLFLICLAIGFLTTLFLLPSWILRVKKAGLVGKDMNKFDKPEVAEVGGVIVLVGFLVGVLAYIALQTFYYRNQANFIEIFASLVVLLLVAFIGFIDDILGWKIGLDKKVRLLLVLFSSIPLVVINAGSSEITLPFLGAIALGLLYPFILVPIGVLGATVTYNFLAGYNGLEASQGILILSGLAFVAWRTGNIWLAFLNLCMVAALLAFYVFNRYPARIFPGDVMTYIIGGLIAITAILGNMERIAIFFFIPYILEVGLKLRGGLKKESFAQPNKDGSLELRYEKLYGLEHVALALLKRIKGKVYERDVVYVINSFQIIIILLGIFIFRSSLF